MGQDGFSIKYSKNQFFPCLLDLCDTTFLQCVGEQDRKLQFERTVKAFFFSLIHSWKIAKHTQNVARTVCRLRLRWLGLMLSNACRPLISDAAQLSNQTWSFCRTSWTVITGNPSYTLVPEGPLRWVPQIQLYVGCPNCSKSSVA